MRYTLENKELRVEIETFGAEIRSVYDKETDREYMWQADAKYWGRTAPVLFPFVGSMKNKEFIHEGKHYPMGQHGFARDMEFKVKELKSTIAGSAIVFELCDDEETRAKFPFAFVLRIGYELVGKRVRVTWEVENPDSAKDLFFSIGAHPAFNCPVHGEENKVGYKIAFDGVTEIHHHGNDGETGLCMMDEDLVLALDENGCASITNDFFDRCTYMIENKQTKKVSLLEPDGENIVTVTFDMPLFALWSPEGKNAPFVCIEPWCGRADAMDFDGELADRVHGNCLAAGDKFVKYYDMEFGKTQEKKY